MTQNLKENRKELEFLPVLVTVRPRIISHKLQADKLTSMISTKFRDELVDNNAK